MNARFANLSEDEIARLLSSGEGIASEQPIDSEFPFPLEFLPGPPRPAAVLIPFLRKAGQWHLLFTRRNASLVEHSGQVSFPGGRADPEDSGPAVTALREAREEIGLQPEDVRILGHLDEFLTITNYLVTPVVGVIPWPYPLRISPIEVSRVFTIPLEWLAAPVNCEEKQRDVPGLNRTVTVYYFHPYDGEVLWGATARFTLTLLKKLNLNGSKTN
jgi:8-oxo-dGTP pyrophosphatase MutT (NUDIX family)